MASGLNGKTYNVLHGKYCLTRLMKEAILERGELSDYILWTLKNWNCSRGKTG